jgi:fibronectin type 3 domain-containing protein
VILSWWNNSQGATSFYIKRLDPNSSSYVIVGSVAAVPGTNTYTDWTAPENSDCGYLVVAVTPDGNVSAVSDTGTITVTTPAAGVINLSTAEISMTQINVSWTLDVPGATEVDVYRWSDGSAPTLLANTPLDASTTPFADTTVTPGIHYYYKICAVDPINGPTGYSFVDAYTPPVAAGAFQATVVSASEIDMAWLNYGNASTVFKI